MLTRTLVRHTLTRGVALSLTPDRLASPLSAVAKLNCNIDDNGEAYFKPRARIERRASEKKREREGGRDSRATAWI